MDVCSNVLMFTPISHYRPFHKTISLAANAPLMHPLHCLYPLDKFQENGGKKWQKQNKICDYSS
jgi:hypothetical protein